MNVGKHLVEHAALGMPPQPRRIPRTFMMSAIPFILSGGTGGGGLNQFNVANNGVVSLLPLPTAYTGWFYCPANAIFAGSAAGWYWFVGSSGTDGVLYNNTYTSGDPHLSAPASPTPFVTTGPGLVTQTTATNIVGPTKTLPGGTLGLNGGFSFDALMTFAPVSANRLWALRYNFSTVGSTSNFSNAQYGARFRGRYWNRNAANKSVASGFTGFSGNTTSGGTYYPNTDSAVDNALDFILLIADAVSNFMVLEAFDIQLNSGD